MFYKVYWNIKLLATSDAIHFPILLLKLYLSSLFDYSLYNIVYPAHGIYMDDG